MNYSTTIAGLIVLVIAWFPNLKEVFSEGEIVQVVEFIVGIASVITVWYGRYKAGGITLLGFRK